MFINPKRLARALARASIVFLLIILILISLGLFTELHVQGISWDKLQADPLRVLEYWPQIARDMVPGLVAMSMAFLLAARFVCDLYQLPKLRQGFGFLLRWRFGSPGFKPYLLIKEGRIDRDKDKVLTRLGGPGNLVIYHDSAVVLEQAGRITRVERSRYARLEAFEKVYKVIDLRPKRKPFKVEALTKEGIPVTCEADVHYRIRCGDQEPSKALPYPMLGREVLKAATCAWKCDPDLSEDGELNWEELIILGYTDGILRSIVARYPLDRLIGPPGWDENERHPRQVIAEELEKELRAAARQVGADILSVSLGDIVVQDEITDQWIAAWQAEWERQCLEQQAEGEAKFTLREETAKAQGQVEMILELIRALRSLADAGALDARLRFMHIVAMLRHASLNAETQAYLPAETLRTLAALQDMAARAKGQQV